MNTKSGKQSYSQFYPESILLYYENAILKYS